MEEEIRVSVRELVAFCFPPADITPGGELRDMLAGGRAHRARQSRQEGATERPLKGAFEIDGQRMELYGRMDAFCDGALPFVEEMKLSRRPPEAALPEHWAQAVCYGAMVAAQGGCAAVRVCVSYVSEEGEVLSAFEQTVSVEELTLETRAWLQRYLVFALREREHRALRDASIRQMPFPYDGYRPGQRELAAQVYTAVLRKKRLFASLPTGTGKSAAVLFPALKALGEGKCAKLVYLTARNTARQSPLMALERMRRQGLHARVTVLTAKEKLCPSPARCHPDDCPRAKGHFLRQEDAIGELLGADAPIWTDEIIVETAQRHCVCPFELALALTELADVALMDLNYAFDPFAQLKRLFQRQRRIALLVDEAYHAVERVRESLSGTADSAALRAFRAAFGKRAGRGHPYYRALNDLIRRLRAITPPEGERESRLAALPDGVSQSVEGLLAEASGVLAAPGAAPVGDVLSVIRLCLPFLYAAEHLDDDYGILLETHGKDRALTLYCLLPAKEIARVTKPMSGAVFFSATLTPLPAMKKLLGGGEEDACFSLPSPFESAHLAVVRRRISTKYADREQSAAQVAASITEAVLCRRGKYIVYFPSYAYLELVRARLDEQLLPPLWVQRRDMTEDDRADFFSAFSETDAPRLGLCVLGGLFGEGIDLPGERLIGVVVVGVGLPTPTLKLRAIQECYQARFGDGFGYACRIPAMHKVLQAGGRVIRSETDKGVLVLLDSRYYDGEYASLLPREWRLRDENIRLAAEELWRDE